MIKTKGDGQAVKCTVGTECRCTGRCCIECDQADSCTQCCEGYDPHYNKYDCEFMEVDK